jgi:hypothetical protein
MARADAGGRPMTVGDAIKRLLDIQAIHGASVEVFFDCPHCGRVTAPDLLETVREKTRAVLQRAES